MSYQGIDLAADIHLAVDIRRCNPQVLVFLSAEDRDSYCEARCYRVHAIGQDSVWLYVDPPAPFTGEARCVDVRCCDEQESPGHIGYVVLAYPEPGVRKLSEFKVGRVR